MCDTFRPLKLSTLRARPRRRALRLLVVRAAVGRAEPGGRDEPSVNAGRASSRSFRGSSRTSRPPSIRSTGGSRRSPRTSRTSPREQSRAAQSRRGVPRGRRGVRRDRRLPRSEPHRRDARERGEALRRHRQLRLPRRLAREGSRESRAVRPRAAGDRRRRRVRARPAGALGDVSIGVWYYDAAHSYEAQLEGLRIAEPLLVSGALVIVDDTDWDDVARAMDDYLEEQAARPAGILTRRRQVTRLPPSGGRGCRCSSGTAER